MDPFRVHRVHGVAAGLAAVLVGLVLFVLWRRRVNIEAFQELKPTELVALARRLGGDDTAQSMRDKAGGAEQNSNLAEENVGLTHGAVLPLDAVDAVEPLMIANAAAETTKDARGRIAYTRTMASLLSEAVPRYQSTTIACRESSDFAHDVQLMYQKLVDMKDANQKRMGTMSAMEKLAMLPLRSEVDKLLSMVTKPQNTAVSARSSAMSLIDVYKGSTLGSVGNMPKFAALPREGADDAADMVTTSFQLIHQLSSELSAIQTAAEQEYKAMVEAKVRSAMDDATKLFNRAADAMRALGACVAVTSAACADPRPYLANLATLNDDAAKLIRSLTDIKDVDRFNLGPSLDEARSKATAAMELAGRVQMLDSYINSVAEMIKSINEAERTASSAKNDWQSGNVTSNMITSCTVALCSAACIKATIAHYADNLASLGTITDMGGARDVYQQVRSRLVQEFDKVVTRAQNVQEQMSGESGPLMSLLKRGKDQADQASQRYALYREKHTPEKELDKIRPWIEAATETGPAAFADAQSALNTLAPLSGVGSCTDCPVSITQVPTLSAVTTEATAARDRAGLVKKGVDADLTGMVALLQQALDGVPRSSVKVSLPGGGRAPVPYSTLKEHFGKLLSDANSTSSVASSGASTISSLASRLATALSAIGKPQTDVQRVQKLQSDAQMLTEAANGAASTVKSDIIRALVGMYNQTDKQKVAYEPALLLDVEYGVPELRRELLTHYSQMLSRAVGSSGDPSNLTRALKKYVEGDEGVPGNDALRAEIGQITGITCDSRDAARDFYTHVKGVQANPKPEDAQTATTALDALTRVQCGQTTVDVNAMIRSSLDRARQKSQSSNPYDEYMAYIISLSAAQRISTIVGGQPVGEDGTLAALRSALVASITSQIANLASSTTTEFYSSSTAMQRLQFVTAVIVQIEGYHNALSAYQLHRKNDFEVLIASAKSHTGFLDKAHAFFVAFEKWIEQAKPSDPSVPPVLYPPNNGLKELGSVWKSSTTQGWVHTFLSSALGEESWWRHYGLTYSNTIDWNDRYRDVAANKTDLLFHTTTGRIDELRKHLWEVVNKKDQHSAYYRLVYADQSMSPITIDRGNGRDPGSEKGTWLMLTLNINYSTSSVVRIQLFDRKQTPPPYVFKLQ